MWGEEGVELDFGVEMSKHDMRSEICDFSKKTPKTLKNINSTENLAG